MEGIIVVNKLKGITSFDVIRKLKKILKTKKIGHTGTLDPLATGVMLMCVGKATKLASDLEAKDKVYIADFVQIVSHSQSYSTIQTYFLGAYNLTLSDYGFA